MKNLEILSYHDLVLINGGHNGDSYNFGKTLGKAVTKVGIVLGIIAIILAPKG